MDGSDNIHIVEGGSDSENEENTSGTPQGIKIEGNVENEDTSESIEPEENSPTENDTDTGEVEDGDGGSEPTSPITPPEQQPSPQTPSTSSRMSTIETPSPADIEKENILQPAPSSATMPTPAQVQQQPNQKKQPNPNTKSARLVMYGIIIVLVIAIAFGAHYLIKPTAPSPSTTTIPYAESYHLSSCSAIAKPGLYYLSGNVVYQSLGGSCISITSSNVLLDCQNASITGSGPYAVGPSYSVGVSISHSDNVSVQNCHITKFSYGLRSIGSRKINVSKDNISYNVQSNLYLNSTKSSTFSNDQFEGIKKNYSSVYLVNGSSYDTLQKDNISSNILGVYINSSSNDTYLNNTVITTAASFECSLDSGVYGTSTAKSNSCTNNYGCSFLSCSSKNVPANISKISLGSRISSCGAIESPGNYYIGNSINAYYVEPFGTAWSYHVPCITIDSPHVNLYCNNNYITNATIGISVVNSYYDNLSNCDTNARAIGIQLINSTGVTITGSKITGSLTGISLQKSSTNVFSHFDVYNNSIGIYLNGSQTETFTSGKAINNSAVDIFATNSSVGQLTNFAENLTCGISDTKWARCSNYITPELNQFYLTSCSALKFSGNYTLQNDVFSNSSACFSIKNVSNITLNCNGHIMTNRLLNGAATSAVLARDTNNITVENCAADNFGTAVNISNSSKDKIINNIATGTFQFVGLSLSTSDYLVVLNNRLSNETQSGIYLHNIAYSNISNNIVKYVKPGGYGIEINNSGNNTIYGNGGIENYVGMFFNGSSTGNLASYNNFSLSGLSDYRCSPSNSGINVENGGINYGSKKSGCLWLAAVQKGQPLSCTSALGPSTYALQSDYAYTSGATCFAVYANDTTINCNNHTVIATNGGTFASFLNSNNDKIYNCNLKGFSPAISIKNSKVLVFNNTIGSNSTSNGSYAVSASGSSGLNIQNIVISSKSNGLYLSHDANGTITNSSINASGISYYFNNTNFFNVVASDSTRSSGTGWFFSNSTQDTVSRSLLYGKVSGLECSGSSSNIDAIIGNGNNYSLVLSCPWAKS